MKLTGALLIMFASTMLGFLQAAQYAKRPRQIRVLIQALQSLETEISYGLTPLPNALEKIGRNLEAPLSELFTGAALQLCSRSGMSTREIWEGRIQALWPATSLGADERAAMLRLGEHLGLSDREDQIKHIRLAMEQLKAEETKARNDQLRYEKMWRSLGVLGGLLVVILLI